MILKTCVECSWRLKADWINTFSASLCDCEDPALSAVTSVCTHFVPGRLCHSVPACRAWVAGACFSGAVLWMLRDWGWLSLTIFGISVWGGWFSVFVLKLWFLATTGRFFFSDGTSFETSAWRLTPPPTPPTKEKKSLNSACSNLLTNSFHQTQL